ncbi:chloride channel protein [Calidifontibacter sp. DB0510]|uniref:Chloride channel protein n=2 Tax=Metallococcus carri TaxID=1656884 RepID=A0A967E818_9MICO|nr:chloride channel protein [Metallococcus carri]NOP37097.1 chloride channel protein [Calidifontibacter sp. DB2511S]
MSSGRASTSQPNVTGDGAAALTPGFWVAIVVTGVAAGLFGAALMELLRAVSRIAYGAADLSGFAAAVRAASPWGRAWPLLVAGVIAGLGGWGLGRFAAGKRTDVDDLLWTGRGRLSVRRSLGTSVLSEAVVGLGASLGREAAPKLMGAVAGHVVAERLHFTPPQVRLLVACGAGAGFASVYNVPFGAALFTAEVLVGAINLPIVLPALACSATATATAWLVLPNQPVYLQVPQVTTTAGLVVFAIVIGPVIGLCATAYVRLIGIVSHHAPGGRWVLVLPSVAFGILALLGLSYPLLYGNGSDIMVAALGDNGTLEVFVALLMLKPLVTVLCLGSGAPGGLFTPVLATGAAFGLVSGRLWDLIWPGTPIAAYVLVAAAAMIGAGMQAPLAGVALVLELTAVGTAVVVPLIAATMIATAVSHRLDGYSIYSARLASSIES